MRIITVTDLHQSRQLYLDLKKEGERQQPDLLALVGDFLDSGAPSSTKFTEQECAELLSGVPCEVVFVRGNHEQENWYAFADAWKASNRPLHALQGAFVFGPLVLIAFPSLIGNDEPFLNGRERITEDNLDDVMAEILATHGRAMRTLWLMHEPPSGTRLTVDNGSSISGHRLWRETILRYSPKLVVSGHDHLTPIRNGIWQDKVGESICMNLGQVDERRPRYLMVDWQFLDDTPRFLEPRTIYPMVDYAKYYSRKIYTI